MVGCRDYMDNCRFALYGNIDTALIENAAGNIASENGLILL